MSDATGKPEYKEVSYPPDKPFRRFAELLGDQQVRENLGRNDPTGEKIVELVGHVRRYMRDCMGVDFLAEMEKP